MMADDAAVAAFLDACPADAWAALGLRGVRALAGELVVSGAREPSGSVLPRAVFARGHRYAVRHERATRAHVHSSRGGGFVAEGARAGSMIESRVGEHYAAGTLGLAFFGTDDQAYFASNWHVLCAEQPDGVRDARVQLAHDHQPIAHVHAFARVDPAGLNTWDLAVARFDDPSLARGRFVKSRGFDGARAAPTQLAPPRAGEVYFKVGASTGYREAIYAGVGAYAIAVGPRARGMRFRRLYFFQSWGPRRFSAGGDSGSIVVHARSGAACALLIGGFDTERGSVSVACPLHEAFEVVGCARTAEGEALPRLDYPRRGTVDLEWVRVGARSSDDWRSKYDDP